MIEAKGLVKKYGKFVAVDNLSMTLNVGESVVLLGANGSGKSTLMSMLALVLKPTEGEVLIDGQKGKKAKSKIAYAPQNIVLFEELTVTENLYAWSSLKGKENVERAEYLISELDMGSFKKKRVDRLSGGQRRRVNIAVAMMGNYDYLFFDEPLAGIDERGAECIEAILRKEKESGRGILLTEHNPTILLPLMDRQLKLDGGHFKES
ncbi:lipopolysaccharide export system ATP-binding protein [Lachnospiraceae bacterium G41]|nr:lipopolysaccharide export system ATP-binding protein [Lachnospiraceae bacterium G41]